MSTEKKSNGKASNGTASLKEYKVGQAFPGVIGRTFDVSRPAWPAPIPEGDHVFSFEFSPTGEPDIARGKGVPANIELFVDGKPVGKGDLPVTIPLSLGLAAGVCVGSDSGSPVMTDYKPPFAFTGTVKKALMDITGEPLEGKEAAIENYLRVAMARQ